MKQEKKEFDVIVKATGEKIRVYRLFNGNYYDADAVSNFKEPSAKQANKKEFTKDELNFLGSNWQNGG